jgi:hypothetical protein
MRYSMFTDIVIIKNNTNKLLMFYATFATANLLYLNVDRSKTGLCEYCRNVDVHEPSYNELILVSHRKPHIVLRF